MLNNAENKMFESVLLTWKKHICKSQGLGQQIYKQQNTQDVLRQKRRQQTWFLCILRVVHS